MIVVHHLERSRSQRVLWLLEELGQPYELVRYARDAKTMLAPPELAQIHPLGKAPIVVDDGLVLAETSAILETLLQRHGAGRFQPQTDEQTIAYRYWMHAAEGSFMPPLVMSLILSKFADPPLPQPMKALATPILSAAADKVMTHLLKPQMTAQFAFMEKTLGAQPWFAGDNFTAADIQMSFPIEAAQARMGLGTSYPSVMAWTQRIQARPAYQTAREKAGPGVLK